jgi:DNA-binding MarR family transcriptional regulator
MAIEDDIQQREFRNPYHKAVINLIFTNSWLMSQQLALLKPFELTPQQYNVLRILRGQYPNSVMVNAIIERMMDKMSNASRLVDKLEAKHLVTRTTCPHDRRAVDVRITDRGLVLLTEIDHLQQEWERRLHSLSETEATLLSQLLDKLRQSGPS